MRKLKNNIINMEHLRKYKDIDLNKTAIGIKKSKRYLELVQDMSDFLNTLHLPEEERTKLINKLVEYDKNVRIDAMVQTLLKEIEIKEL